MPKPRSVTAWMLCALLPAAALAACTRQADPLASQDETVVITAPYEGTTCEALGRELGEFIEEALLHEFNDPTLADRTADRAVRMGNARVAFINGFAHHLTNVGLTDCDPVTVRDATVPAFSPEFRRDVPPAWDSLGLMTWDEWMLSFERELSFVLPVRG